MTVLETINVWLAAHENVRFALVLLTIILVIYFVSNFRDISERIRARVGRRNVVQVGDGSVKPVHQAEKQQPVQNAHQQHLSNVYSPNTIASHTQARLKQNVDAIVSDLSQVDETLLTVENDIRSKKAVWEQLKSQRRSLQGMLDAAKKEMDAVEQVLLNGALPVAPRPPIPKPGEPSIEALFNEVTKHD